MKKIYRTCLLALALFGIGEAKAQLNPLGAQYYNNEYLINPAYAGKEEGLRINGAYRKLWSGLPGAPLTQNITADYGFNRVGIGVNVNNESAGLLRQTRATASYAYHLPLDSGKNQLHFGLAIGVMTQHLDNNNVNGNPNDISIGDYNGRRAYIDGDFGIAYTSERLSIQASIPNLNDFFNKSQAKVADLVTFYSAIGYNFDLKGGMEIEPKVAFRGIRNYKNMLDFGGRMAFADRKFFFTGLYHSNKSSTLGIGLDFMKKYLISGMYTTETSALNSYANGSFELNLRISFKK
ncbi:PorP/SprF family type IX secretion system membrane protein [Pedobacter sp. Du54]|uniref:PorP/SprF family type IX secretion system membrane protein n=1 Tax=Pedobacter anseongensis TaxID=3133439 RepID=UPI00309560E2